jgi:dihydroflavonol-4-reductase
VPDVFLTGGSGFLGGAVLRHLTGTGRHVLALARSDEAARVVAEAGAEPVRGDVREAGGWMDRFAGCETVFHVAGEVAMCDPSQLEVNVAGTALVIEAAARAGVRRVVHTSSAATIGEGRGQVGSEATTHSGDYLSPYARSKHRAELLAFSEGRRLGIEVVAVNPSSVQGPGRAHGSARLFIRFLRGRLRWAVRTRIPLVYLGDAVAAHALAERHGADGERYLATGWNPTVEEALALLATVGGVSHQVRFLPAWVMTVGASLVEALWRVSGRVPPVCRAMAREVRHGHAFDGSRAERDLDLRYTPPEAWLAETVQWYREQGLV